MKFKKILLLSTLPIIGFTISSCGYVDEIHEIEKTTYDFVNLNKEYNVYSKSLNTYKFDNHELIYVNINEFLKTLDGFSNYSNYSFYRIEGTPRFNITWSDSIIYRITFNCEEETISYNYPASLSNIYETQQTNFSYGITVYDGDLSGGGEVTYSLKGLFDIHIQNDQLYLPFSIANIIFCSTNYYNIYFNGDKFYGVDIDLADIDQETKELIRTSSINNTPQSSELREANYNTILFLLNNLYGVKKVNNVADYDSYIPESIKEKILASDAETYLDGYKDLIYFLDDPHTTITSAPLNGPANMEVGIDKTKYGERYKSLIDTKNELTTSFEGKDLIQYYDNTALIHLTEFKTGSRNQIYENGKISDNAKDYDSYYFMKYAMDEIENHSNINNVILELTLSPGGNVGAAYRVLGFMTNKNVDIYNYQINGDIVVHQSLKLDTNLNGSYTDNDAYTKYNWTILTSNYSYSAANTTTMYAKNLGIKQIGEKTGGGEFSILPVTLPDGTGLRMSGLIGFVSPKNGKINHIEYGVTPDLEIERNKLYDLQYLDSVVDNLY